MSLPEPTEADSRFMAWLVDEHAAAVFEGSQPPSREQPTQPGEDGEARRRQAQVSLRALEQLRRDDLTERVRLDSEAAVDPEATVDPAAQVPRLDRFEIHEELGRGGHGVVYRAFDPGLNREVALKLPRAEAVFSPEIRQRLLREARSVSSLSHPHLLPIFDVGESGPACYIASEYCSGPSLSQWLKKQTQPVNPRLAAKIIAALTDAVRLVHRHGILHRDLKPSNVLLFESQLSKADNREDLGNDSFPYVPKLTDFGLAKLNDGSEMTQTGELVGTPAYMSPEQAEGRNQDVDDRTDVYSLGVILYELLTGRPPFSGPSDVAILRRVSGGSFPSPRKIRRGIPRELEAVCLKCLAFDRKQRYVSADSLLADLNRYLTGRLVQARPVGPVRQLLNWARRRPMVAGLSGALACSSVLAFAVVTWQWRLADFHRREADRNFQIAHHELREIHAILYAGGTYDAPVFQPLRFELMQALVDYYETLNVNNPEDPELRADMADALYHKGFLAEAAGNKLEAERCYMRSFPLWDDLAREEPLVKEHQYYLAKVHEHLANIRSWQNRFEEALQHHESAFALRKTLVEEYPDELGFQNELAHSYRYLGDWHLAQKDENRAFELYSASHELGRGLLEENPESIEFRERQSKVCYKLAQLNQRLKRPEMAICCCEEAQRMLQSLIASEPEAHEKVFILGRSEYLAGCAYINLRDFDRASKSYEVAQSRFHQLLRDDPAHAEDYQLSLQMTSAMVAKMNLRKDRTLRRLKPTPSS